MKHKTAVQLFNRPVDIVAFNIPVRRGLALLLV